MPDLSRSGQSRSGASLSGDHLDDQDQFAALRQALSQSLSVLRPDEPVAVACSGGADSAALALMAAALCRTQLRPLYLFHIHHGLYAQADEWQARVQALATHLGLPWVASQVQVRMDGGKGVEAAARQARYQALSSMALAHQIRTVLFAHHRQDQAETVLLRLLRGSGVLGLAAMRGEVDRAGLRILRPWLAFDRSQLLGCVAEFSLRTGWQPVVDPSNTDPQYARGALRRDVLPALDAHWPAWQQTLARHARQAQDAIEIMDEVAASDLSALRMAEQDGSLSLKLWRLLSPARQALVLRYWLQQQSVAMPGDRKLAELLRQLRQLHQLGHDRDLLWRHDSYVVRCRLGRVQLMQD